MTGVQTCALPISPYMRHYTAFAAILLFSVASASSAPRDTQMEPKPNPKLACKLSPEQLQKQRQELLPGLFKRADKLTDLTGLPDAADGIRLHFAHRPGLLAHLARIIAREQDCCSFLSFQITVEPSGGPVTFDITGPAGTRDLLKAL